MNNKYKSLIIIASILLVLFFEFSFANPVHAAGEDPTPTETPFHIETPISTETPVPTEMPVSTETPVTTETPFTTDALNEDIGSITLMGEPAPMFASSSDSV
jgi:hypothetical protein